MTLCTNTRSRVCYVRVYSRNIPIAQTSTGGPYCVSPTSSSGALYHLVATYSVYSPPGPAVREMIKGYDDTASYLRSYKNQQIPTHM